MHKLGSSTLVYHTLRYLDAMALAASAGLRDEVTRHQQRVLCTASRARYEYRDVNNGVTDQVQFIHGDAADVAPLFAPVDLVLSNILRVVNVALLPEIVASLRPGGIAIFSGMEEPEEPLFLPELSAAGLTVVDQARDAGWWAVATRR